MRKEGFLMSGWRGKGGGDGGGGAAGGLLDNGARGLQRRGRVSGLVLLWCCVLLCCVRCTVCCTWCVVICIWFAEGFRETGRRSDAWMGMYSDQKGVGVRWRGITCLSRSTCVVCPQFWLDICWKSLAESTASAADFFFTPLRSSATTRASRRIRILAALRWLLRLSHYSLTRATAVFVSP